MQFEDGVSRQSLGLNGRELFSVEGITQDFQPGATITLVIERENGEKERVSVLSRLDTFEDVRYLRSGGLLPQLLIESMQSASLN